MEEVQNRRGAPRSVRVAKVELRQLVFRLTNHPPAVLAVALELVNELIDHLPQPQVGELHVDVAVKNHAEQIGVVVPGFHALFKRGGSLAEHVPKVHLLVQQTKNVVVVRVLRNALHGRPRARFEVPLGNRGEALLVHAQDLVHVFLPDVPVKIHHELLHHVRHGFVRLGDGDGGVGHGAIPGPVCSGGKRARASRSGRRAGPRRGAKRRSGKGLRSREVFGNANCFGGCPAIASG